jgi:predicted ArsR family transcriptional regulator
MHLSERDMTIAEVSENFDMTRAAVKKHLTILQEGKLISVKTRGRERVNRLEPKAMQPVSEWINYFSQFWDERLAALKHEIEKGRN